MREIQEFTIATILAILTDEEIFELAAMFRDVGRSPEAAEKLRAQARETVERHAREPLTAIGGDDEE